MSVLSLYFLLVRPRWGCRDDYLLLVARQTAINNGNPGIKDEKGIEVGEVRFVSDHSS